jgi:protein-disulfide isomerase
MKNNILIVFLVVLVVVLGGASLMFGLGNAVSVAIAPLATKITELTSIEKEIQKKQDVRGNTDPTTSQLIFLTQRVAMLEARLGNSAGGNYGQHYPGQQQYGQQQPGQQRPMPSQEDFNKVYPIDIGTSPILGKPNAPVTIVEFSDFQCPFCARFHPVLRDVLKAYPDKVRIVIKNFPLPFHPNARPAAKLALSAGLQGKYYGMVDLLMQNGGSVEDNKVKEYAKTLGLNYNKLMDDYKNKDAQWEKIISDDMTLANQVNVHGTPTFFINGRQTSARDLNSYKTEIDKI